MSDTPDGTVELELCPRCFCMTWAMADGSCGKCKEPKQ